MFQSVHGGVNPPIIADLQPPPITLLMVNHKGLILAVPVSPDSTYSQLFAKVSGKWPEIRPSSIRCLYSVGDYENVCMSSEDDFPCLLLLIAQFKCERVSVFLKNDDISNDEFLETHRNVDADYLSPNQKSSLKNSRHKKSKHSSSPQSEAFSQTVPTTGEVNELADGDNDTPFYDVCPSISKKPFLSDSWSNNIRGVGQKFVGGVIEFREELIKFAARNAFKYKFKKNNPKAISVCCYNNISTRCEWRICGTVKELDGPFVINRAHLIHNCSDLLVKDDTTRLNPKVCSTMVLEKVRQNPSYSGVDVQEHLKSSYGFHLNYSKAYRTLQFARDRVYGHYKESFDQLRWYGMVAQKTNPGTEVSLESDPLSHDFIRFFISFKASIDGFKQCRPMLFIDATSLKGKFKGQLLTAIAKDGDNGLFPVAFAIVDAETTAHWAFFLSRLRDIIKHDKQVFYISDRHAGIMAAFPLVWEKPVHFFCLYHLYNNLKGVYSGGWSNPFRKKMVNLFKKCAHAPTLSLFKIALAAFEEAGGPLATKWLSTIPVEKWAVSASPNIVRFGELTSNAAESFNKRLVPIRGLPAAHLIDEIRLIIMGWFVERRDKSAKWTGALCPYREHIWNTYKAKSRGWQIKTCSAEGKVYEVISSTSEMVDLRKKTCSCTNWQVKGFPCAHAVSVISLHMPHISGIVDPCFFTSTFRKAYAHDIMPVPTSMRPEAERELGADNLITAPKFKVPAGRPKKKRIPSFGEVPMKKSKPWQCPSCSRVGRHDQEICAALLDSEIVGIDSCSDEE